MLIIASLANGTSTLNPKEIEKLASFIQAIDSGEYTHEFDDGIRKLGQRDIKDLIDVLRSFGPRQGVITSIPLVAGGLGNAAWDGNEIRLFSYDDLGSSCSGDCFICCSVES